MHSTNENVIMTGLDMTVHHTRVRAILDVALALGLFQPNALLALVMQVIPLHRREALATVSNPGLEKNVIFIQDHVHRCVNLVKGQVLRTVHIV